MAVLFPRAWGSYSFLSINWLDPRYKYPMSSKLPADVRQIEAICIYKETYIYFLLSSLFSIVIVLICYLFHLLLFVFLCLSPPPIPPMNAQAVQEGGRRTRPSHTAVRSTGIGLGEVYVCSYFPCVAAYTSPALSLQPALW